MALFKGTFTFVPLTRTHYSNLSLISKHAQICPSAVKCTYRNALPCRFRPVKAVWPLTGRSFDIFAPPSLQVGPTHTGSLSLPLILLPQPARSLSPKSPRAVTLTLARSIPHQASSRSSNGSRGGASADLIPWCTLLRLDRMHLGHGMERDGGCGSGGQPGSTPQPEMYTLVG